MFYAGPLALIFGRLAVLAGTGTTTGVLLMGLAWIFRVVLIGTILKLLTAMGFGYVAYNVAGSVLDGFQDRVLSTFATLPAEMLNIMALFRIDDALQFLLGALTAAATLRGLNAAGRIVTGRLGGPPE